MGEGVKESSIPFYASIILVVSTIVSMTYVIIMFPEYAQKALIIGLVILIIVFLYPITSYVYRKIALAAFTEYFTKKGVEAGEIPVKKFSARAVALIEISLAAIAVSIVLAYIMRVMGISFRIAVFIILSIILIPPVALFSYFIVPVFKISTRRVSAEDELPFFIQSLYVLSYTHLSFEGALLRLREFLTLESWKHEIDRVARLAHYFGEPLIKAFGRVSSFHPSPKIRSFMTSLSSIASVKGTVRGTIDTIFDNQTDKIEVEIKSLADKIDLLGGLGLIVYIFVPIVTVSISPIMGASSIQAYLFILVVLFIAITFLLYYVAEAYYPKAFKVFSPWRPLITSLVGIPVAAVIMWQGYPADYTARIGLATLAILAGPTVAYYIYFRREDRLERYISMLIDDVVTRYTITGIPPAKIIDDLKGKYPIFMLPIMDAITKAIGGDEKVKKRALGMMPTRYHANLIETLITSIEVGTKAETMFALSKTLTRMTGLMETIRGRGATTKYMALTGGVTGGLVLGLMAKSYQRMAEMMHSIQSNPGAVNMPSMIAISINPATVSIMGALVIVGIFLFSVVAGKIWKGNPFSGLGTAFMSTIAYLISYLVASFLYALIT